MVLSTLKSLLQQITTHPALDNAFYREWMSRGMAIEELELVARNYGAWVKSFPDALAILVLSTSDLDAKTEYVKTLYSEMGYGNTSKAHSLLLEAFFTELAGKLGQESRLDRERLEREIEILPSTERLIAGERTLYQDGLKSVGAQLALEWQAYTMLRQLYEGARNYLPLWPNPDEFHEACEYFYTHIGAAEKDHKEESLKAVTQYMSDEDTLAQILDGYHRHLELISGFWEGLYNATSGLAAKSSAAV
jgi:pyrroloquinoline quinone (PQQ) biosynthesis protein C